MKKYYLLPFFVFLTICAAAQVDTSYFYESKEIGWKIEVPGGWRILDDKLNEELNNVGDKMLEEGLGHKIKYSPNKNLVSFDKNPFNSFVSSIELANLDSVAWQKTDSNANEVICKTLQQYKINFDTASRKEVIDGLKFNVFTVITYRPNGEIFLTQDTYSRLINKWIFSVVLSYNNETDKKALVDIWNRSIF